LTKPLSKWESGFFYSVFVIPVTDWLVETPCFIEGKTCFHVLAEESAFLPDINDSGRLSQRVRVEVLDFAEIFLKKLSSILMCADF